MLADLRRRWRDRRRVPLSTLFQIVSISMQFSVQIGQKDWYPLGIGASLLLEILDLPVVCVCDIFFVKGYQRGQDIFPRNGSDSPLGGSSLNSNIMVTDTN